MKEYTTVGDWIKDITTAAQGLYESTYHYLSWDKGNGEACLDGDFTAEQLITIGEFMKKEEK